MENHLLSIKGGMMQHLQEIALWIFVFSYAIFMVIILPLGIVVLIKDLRNRKQFSTDIQEKLNSGIDINVELIRYISRARGLKEGAANASLRKMLSDSRDKDLHQVLLKLCNEMDLIEPYSDLPAEVRLSLIRLKEIIKGGESPHSEDILQPIISNLSAYVNLKNDYLKSKKITFLVNIFGFMSFVFGIWGLVISMSSPNIDQIRSVVDSSIEVINKNPDRIKK